MFFLLPCLCIPIMSSSMQAIPTEDRNKYMSSAGASCAMVILAMVVMKMK